MTWWCSKSGGWFLSFLVILVIWCYWKRVKGRDWQVSTIGGCVGGNLSLLRRLWLQMKSPMSQTWMKFNCKSRRLTEILHHPFRNFRYFTVIINVGIVFNTRMKMKNCFPCCVRVFTTVAFSCCITYWAEIRGLFWPLQILCLEKILGPCHNYVLGHYPLML